MRRFIAGLMGYIYIAAIISILVIAFTFILDTCLYGAINTIISYLYEPANIIIPIIMSMIFCGVAMFIVIKVEP